MTFDKRLLEQSKGIVHTAFSLERIVLGLKIGPSMLRADPPPVLNGKFICELRPCPNLIWS